MNQLNFRPATASDLSAIVAMLADDELGRQREDSSVPLNRKYLDSFAAIDSDPNLGMWRGQIESVRIAAGHRGEGLGRKMFEWAISECRSRGCGLVQLTSDKSRVDAYKFYESLGFKASHEGMKLTL